MMFTITDDSGMIGLIDPYKYDSFVNDEWEYEELMNHFKGQKEKRSMCLFNTGEEGEWNIHLTFERRNGEDFNRESQLIEVTNNQICLINYESLTMAAQFKDVHLPEKHMSDLCFSLENGLYQCRIVQLDYLEEAEDTVHFVLEMIKEK